MLGRSPDLSMHLKMMRNFEKKLDLGRSKMLPYMNKPWSSKSNKRRFASFSLCAIFGSGFSYFLMQVPKWKSRDAILCGAALTLILFLIFNFCVCIRASRVQDLNNTISEVAQDLVREVDQIIHEGKQARKKKPDE